MSSQMSAQGEEGEENCGQRLGRNLTEAEYDL
jgi:hypothetical protein